MGANYAGLFQIRGEGAVLDLPTVNDVQTVGKIGQDCRIVNVRAFVSEAIMCATTQAVVDIGTAADADAFVDGWEPEDNQAIDTIITCPDAKIDAAVAKRRITADDVVIAKVVVAGAEAGAETGQLVVILELVAEI